MRIATYNVQNLRLRRGDGVARLDGAWDDDVAPGREAAEAALDQMDRALTAEVIRMADADIVALQEVFDQATLDHFHDVYLAPTATAYPYRICLPGNDGRGQDVALMSRQAPKWVESHAAETATSLGIAPASGMKATARLFRRDCLEAEFGPLVLYVCHFKAPYPDAAAAARVRRVEAAAVSALIQRRFADPAAGLWLVLGDLNEPGRPASEAPPLAPLWDVGGVDLMLRLPLRERWSFHVPGSQSYTRPDALIASPALAARCPEARPRILRVGLDRAAARYSGPRLAGVGQARPHASDHALVLIELPGL